MIPLIIVLSVLALVILGGIWLTWYLNQDKPVARFVDKPNMILVAKGRWCDHKNPLEGKKRGCIHKFRLECTYCGWKDNWEHDSAFAPERYLSHEPGDYDWHEKPFAPDHTCPSIEALVKPKSWELL